jgi:ArsR family transcriptional regulator, arsenate/arsenite/antimonite-responsive transcriptional repressor
LPLRRLPATLRPTHHTIMEKKRAFDQSIPRLARKLKVCGHPVRLRLLCAIASREPCVSDLSTCVSESQPVVSQHLAVLKKEGIVTSIVRGNRRIYSVADPFVRTLLEGLDP